MTELANTYHGRAIALEHYDEEPAGEPETIMGAFRVVRQLPGGLVLGNGEEPESFWAIWTSARP